MCVLNKWIPAIERNVLLMEKCVSIYFVHYLRQTHVSRKIFHAVLEGERIDIRIWGIKKMIWRLTGQHIVTIIDFSILEHPTTYMSMRSGNCLFLIKQLQNV